jgi:chemotaxis protein MotB
MIVEMQAQHTLVAQRHRVYVDWGSEDGLAVGDQLEVFRVRVGLPNRPVGEVKIIALEEHTATGIIVRSTAPFSIGDRFIHKRIDQDAADRNGQVNHIGTTSAEAKAKVLTASLGAEIAKGGVRVRQEGDKVKISLDDLVDQLEYESGQAVIKPNGIKILKQISDILKTMMDQHIQVEGHTDSMRIGPGLITKFPTNQELSEARANLVVRFFMEEGVDPSSLSAVGYSDERPVASNATEEGRRKNRRIEIELSPKQLPERVPAAAPFQP